MSLLEKLEKYSGSGACPMHMPGHKRNSEFSSGLPINIDITEIDGFDNLHGSEGVLLDLANECASLYGCKRAFPLVNGSTCGILAAITAVAGHGSSIIAARNCHKSVYNAIALNRLKAHYIMPPADSKYGINGSIRPDDVKVLLKQHPEVSCVVITSPTYEGVVSDVEAISKICHEYGVPLIVDQAHGAHLGFCRELPPNAVGLGADIVIMSLHKTLPAMTQTALLCTNADDRIIKALGRQLAVFETSSPSYVLLASIDNCISILKNNCGELFRGYVENLRRCYVVFQKLQKLSVISPGNSTLPFFDFDMGKFVVSTKGTSISGVDLAKMLRKKFNIEVEMAASDYIIAMTGICDTEENLSRFCAAVEAVDGEIELTREPIRHLFNVGVPTAIMSAWEASAPSLHTAALTPEKAENKICAEYIWAYPPGIPIIVPGEQFSADILAHMQHMSKCGVTLHSDSGLAPDAFLCIYDVR